MSVSHGNQHDDKRLWSTTCPKCQYDTVGLPSERCPECGITRDDAQALLLQQAEINETLSHVSRGAAETIVGILVGVNGLRTLASSYEIGFSNNKDRIEAVLSLALVGMYISTMIINRMRILRGKPECHVIWKIICLAVIPLYLIFFAQFFTSRYVGY